MKLVTHIDYEVTHIDPYLFQEPQDLFQMYSMLLVWSAKNDGDLEEDVRQYMFTHILQIIRI